ncbi:hypothetical protein C0J52_15023 [Blattella germanica]|nr:hypothetical protein C0J52_15023 [Blattella germanica]
MEEIFIEEEFSNHHHLLRLSPYNPMLNPIESAWSCLKVAVKRNLSMQLPQILAGEDRANILQYEYRLSHLENLINQNNCSRYVGQVQRYIPDSRNLIDLTCKLYTYNQLVH